VLKPAESNASALKTLASAERQRSITEAEGRASAIRAQGEAEAEIIFKKGEAEAKAMNVKAEAFQEYNQAAVLDKFISGMPEVVRALAEPLRQGRQGDHRFHRQWRCCRRLQADRRHYQDCPQVPALFEALSACKSELLSKVRLIGDKAPKPEPPSAPIKKAVMTVGMPAKWSIASVPAVRRDLPRTPNGLGDGHEYERKTFAFFLLLVVVGVRFHFPPFLRQRD